MNAKKKAAAIAAVIDYIKTQEEAIMMQAAAAPPEPVTAVAVPPALWGISGRQELMQMRNMMQMKAFHGIK